MTGNPVTELERAFRRMGRHFGVLSARRERPSTGLDVRDTGETFEVVGETPGARPDDVQVQVADQLLEITVEAASDVPETTGEHDDEPLGRDTPKEGEYVRRERPEGVAQRSIHLPVAVDPERAEASAARGVVRVRMPKLGAGDDATEIPVS